MIRSIIQLFGRLLAGIGAAGVSVSMPFKKYPFTFPEKALTADWEMLGYDLQKAISKLEGNK